MCGENRWILLDLQLRNLPCKIVEADEIWTFVREKQRRPSVIEQLNPELGDQYAYVALDRASRLVLVHVLGKCEPVTTREMTR